MTVPRVAAFTDTYLPTINGVTYTVKTWRDRWEDRGGRMDVVYPESGYDPDDAEYPVKSMRFPFYDGFRMGIPSVPDEVAEAADVVHAHTPFGVGIGALRLARSEGTPFVASYHTPSSEYAAYLANGRTEEAVRKTATSWERWFLDHADTVVVPSVQTKEHVRESIGVEANVEVVPNGVDTQTFCPTESVDLRAEYDLPDGPLVGYTGRHGYEKNLDLLVEAVAAMEEDVSLVVGGDGPAREDLEAAAAEQSVDAHFLGFLDRAELPAFYSMLDVFGFPSPVETQGLVALEANACGTPVAGVDEGALADTIEDGVNGYAAATAEVEPFVAAIERTFAERATLREQCLDRRAAISVDHAVDQLEDVYTGLND